MNITIKIYGVRRRKKNCIIKIYRKTKKVCIY